MLTIVRWMYRYKYKYDPESEVFLRGKTGTACVSDTSSLECATYFIDQTIFNLLTQNIIIC